MKLNREHIIYKITTFILVVSLLLPATVKLAHSFSHHEHEVCISNASTHIHKVDLDCDFNKFTTFSHFFNFNDESELPFQEVVSKSINLHYFFLNNHRTLSFSLRGPPSFV